MLDYDKILGNEEFQDKYVYLFERWLDECRYEDINDYAKALKELVEKYNGQPVTLVNVRPVRKPFGITFTTKEDGKRWKLYFTESGEMGIFRIG